MGILNIFAESGDLEGDINSLALRVVGVSAVALIILILVASQVKSKKSHLKAPLFWMIAAIVSVATFTLLGSTIYLNTKSDSGGPVHWHADIEFWACGTQLELRDPSGFLSNKIGTPTYHEHDDQRIHLEGVVVDENEDASLGKFIRVVGGSITSSELVLPLADGIVEDETDGDKSSTDTSLINDFIGNDTFGKKTITLNANQTCGGEYSEPQTYVYSYNKENKTYSQRKLDDPSGYVIRDESVVPPGDCVIVEFGPVSDTTDKLCRQYGIRDADRCVEFGVEEFNPKLCEISEIKSGGNE